MVAIFRAGWAVLCCLSLSACAAPSPFPSEVMENVDPTFHFEAWRDAPPNNAAGKAEAGKKVELGGRIVQAESKSEGVLIVAEQLQIRRHPVYGPTEEVKRAGVYEFAFLYPGPLKKEALRTGNRFVLIGTTDGREHVVVRGAPKSEPYLVADCVHIWQTGSSEIASFREDAGAGYSSLPEETYCAPKKK